MESNQRRAVKYRRISDDREGRELGIGRQDHDLDQLAERLGVEVVGDYCDNDIGASTRSTKPRPEYDRMLVDGRGGRFDVVLAYTSSRLTRRPREHEDLIELAEQHGVEFTYVRSPSFDLNTADGRAIARILAAQDAAESERISERVKRAQLEHAQAGTVGARGGRRPFGFKADRVTIEPSEAAEIGRWADALLGGVSLRQVTADLRRRGVPTVTGTQWQTRTVRDILLRPRTAGLVVHNGEIIDGVTAPWPPILPRDVWDAVRALLTDPTRRTSPGSTPRWLLSGIAVCGHPDCIDRDPPVPMRVGTSGGAQRNPSYGCRDHRHVTRDAAALDAYITDVVVRRLKRPDAVDLLTRPEPSVDTAALARDAAALRTRIGEAKDAWEAGVLTLADMKVRVNRLTDRLAEIEERQRAAVGHHPLARIAGRADAAEVWKRLDLGQRRAIVEALITVAVLPQRKGRMPDGSRFDPNAIRVGPARR